MAPLCLLACASSSFAVTLFNPDTFEDGTIMGWGGADPANVSGGAQGSSKALGAGSGTFGNRPFMAVENGQSRYTGNWLAAHATGVKVDMRALSGSEPIVMHLVLFGDNGSRWETTEAYALNPGSGFWAADFDVSDLVLVSGSGTLNAALGNISRVMFRHNTTLQAGGESVNGQLVIDNVQVVPEPGTWAALGLGALAVLRRKK